VKKKNDIQRQQEVLDAQERLRNTRIKPETRKSLSSKIGGLKSKPGKK